MGMNGRWGPSGGAVVPPPLPPSPLAAAALHLGGLGHQLHILTSVRHNDEPLMGVPVTTLPGFHPRRYRLHSLTLPSWRMVRGRGEGGGAPARAHAARR